jgi:hypothetical protein
MLETIDHRFLDGVCGGLPNGVPSQKQPEPKTWIDGLNRSLNRRGYDPNIDPKMERKPSNPGMDPGIIRQWNPFAAPRRERSA